MAAGVVRGMAKRKATAAYKRALNPLARSFHNAGWISKSTT